jgi:four helix bundle protein
MEKSRDLRVRAFDFVVAVVDSCRTRLLADPILSRLAFQLLDAAGSVGANLEESADGQSKADFIAKQFIALKEARESRFWLRVISAAYPEIAPTLRNQLQESNEIVAMVTASIRKAKSNPHRGSA